MVRMLALAAALWGIYAEGKGALVGRPFWPHPSPQARVVLELTNRERAWAGLPPLALDGRLCAAAQAHAQDMVRRRYLSHVSPEGERVPVRIERAGYAPWSACGENIAAGQATAADAVAAWMASASHRENILCPYYRELGVGMVWDPAAPYVWYWVQVFGARGGAE